MKAPTNNLKETRRQTCGFRSANEYSDKSNNNVNGNSENGDGKKEQVKWNKIGMKLKNDNRKYGWAENICEL